MNGGCSSDPTIKGNLSATRGLILLKIRYCFDDLRENSDSRNVSANIFFLASKNKFVSFGNVTAKEGTIAFANIR
jgi:hypothetical protein